MLYPAAFEHNVSTGCYIITFRDIPEAITQGYSLEEAIEEAKDALLTAMEFYFEDERSVPMPSKPLQGEELIELPISVWAKVLLLNSMLELNISQSELGRRLHKSRQEVQRIINLEHNTKIDTIADAFKVLGKKTSFLVL